MKYTHTLFVTLGRNVGSKPMERLAWLYFRESVFITLSEHNCEVLQRPVLAYKAGTQIGTWEGNVEDACTFVALIDARDTENLKTLKTELRTIRESYAQEAIGFALCKGTNNLL